MPAENTNQRIKWIDVCRALAILMVVLCHATENVYSLSVEGMADVPFYSKIFAFTAFAFGRLGVPLFLMITGYLLLDRVFDTAKIIKFWKTRWLNLLISTLVWFVIYDLFLIFYCFQPVSITDFLGNMLFLKFVNMGHVWFMSLILGMYILIPIVAIGLSKVSTKILMFPVMIFTVYSFLFPTLLTILEILHINPGYSVNFSLGFSGGAGGLFIIYGYLLKKGLLKKIKTWVLAIIFVVTFFLGDAFQFWAYSNGVTYNMGYVNVLQLIASLALFEIMSRIIIQKESFILTAISKFSFPIYLIHNIFICMCLPFVLAMELANPAKVVILYFLCFIAAFALAKVISLIPKVGKFILYLK